MNAEPPEILRQAGKVPSAVCTLSLVELLWDSFMSVLLKITVSLDMEDAVFNNMSDVPDI